MDVDAAIQSLTETLAATPAYDPTRAVHLVNLGIMLMTRFEQAGAPADLDAAVEAAREAVAATPADHPNRALYLNNLGNNLETRFELMGVQDDLDAAVSAFVRATEVSSATPSWRIRTARSAAGLIAASDPGQAAGLLAGAVRLLPEVTPRQLERGDQQYAIGEFAGLAADAAALALCDPAVPARQRPAKALSLLEAGRAVLLSQALRTRSDLTDLRDQHPALATRFTELRDLLDSPSQAPELRNQHPATARSWPIHRD